MRLILRNIARIFSRFKLAMTLNIFGLSVAFVAFMLLMMQWVYDKEFDTHDPAADSIYRIDCDGGERGVMAIICRPLAEIIEQSSPHIKAGCLMNVFAGDAVFTTGDDGNKHIFREKCISVSPEITKVFKFDMVEGDASSLEIEGNLLMPESMAKRVFGGEPATGKTITYKKNNLTIGGVFKDFPENNTLNNTLYQSIGDDNKGSWNNWNYNFYVKTDMPGDAEALSDIIKSALAKEENLRNFNGDSPNIIPIQLTKIHSSEPITYDATPRTSRSMMFIIVSIAIVILVIATINFTNFSTAISPLRIKSITTQKVFGATRQGLRRDLLTESVLTSLISFGIGLIILQLTEDTRLAQLFNADVHIAAHPMLITATGIVAILVGFVAGAYPSYYTTSFEPAIALKGSFGVSPKGKAMRSILVGIQFIASFALIISSLFMYLQNRFTHTQPLGFEKEQLIIAHMGNVGDKYKVFSQQLKGHPEIADVTFANTLLCQEEAYMNWGREFRDESISYDVLEVSPSFLSIMGIKPSEGRDFREEDQNTRHGVYIFNETAAKKYNLHVGDAIDSTTIVGIVPDFFYTSMHKAMAPAAFLLWGKLYWGNEGWDANGRSYSTAYIKTNAGADLHNAIEAVRHELEALSPDYPYDVKFFDTVLDKLYHDDRQFTTLITLFSLLAVLISIAGVFGLVVFDSEYKRKEIGIRKVMGATIPQILLMLNKGYIITLTVCFLLASPIAYYGISQWLENFAYKIPIYWWVFPIALVIVSVITLATVTYQSWHAANENPVNSIKSE